MNNSKHNAVPKLTTVMYKSVAQPTYCIITSKNYVLNRSWGRQAVGHSWLLSDSSFSHHSTPWRTVVLFCQLTTTGIGRFTGDKLELNIKWIERTEYDVNRIAYKLCCSPQYTVSNLQFGFFLALAFSFLHTYTHTHVCVCVSQNKKG